LYFYLFLLIVGCRLNIDAYSPVCRIDVLQAYLCFPHRKASSEA
jgi:hypothetical protein